MFKYTFNMSTKTAASRSDSVVLYILPKNHYATNYEPSSARNFSKSNS